MFEPFRNIVFGAGQPVTVELDIATTTAVKYGAIVKLSAGLVVLGATTEATAICGVAAEAHAGAADAFNPRANGDKILVYANPYQIFKADAPIVTATGGSTTTIVSTDIDSAGTDDSFNSGFARLTYKGANSTNTDPIGTIYKISDYDASEDTLTIAAAGGAVTAGDKFAIFPPLGFDDFSYDATLTTISLADDGQAAMKVVGYIYDDNKKPSALMLLPALHFFGNKNS